MSSTGIEKKSPLKENGSCTSQEEILTDFWTEDTKISISNMEDGARIVFYQSLVPFLFSGLISIAAGLIMYRTSYWDQVKEKPQFIAIIPPLQGMKGNLDMTFTSRLTTMIQQQNFNVNDGLWLRVFRNIAFLEGLAIPFSQLVILISFLVDLPRQAPPGCALNSFVFLGSVAVLAVSVSCCLMTFVILGIVFLGRRYKCNPDNIATPFASSLGDLATLSLMLASLYVLCSVKMNQIYFSWFIVLCMCCMIPLWMMVAWKDEEAREAVKSQWLTMFAAVFIASIAGFLFEMAHQEFPDILAYQPLISGVSGNRAVLLATRLSTHLNIRKSSYLPFSSRINPLKYFFGRNSKESKTACMLLLTSPVFQGIFVGVTLLIARSFDEPLRINIYFICGYLLTTYIQVFFLLYFAQLIVITLYKCKMNPDIHSIPIITAIGDFMGTSLLVALFHIIKVIVPHAVKIKTSIVTNNTTCIN